MKFMIKLFLFFTAVAFLFIALIKVIQNCSWKEAVGITEELLKEI